jgi:uncharacterized protein YdhG (YjbR/CyaY superfamily)
MKQPGNVDEYIAAWPLQVQDKLNTVRQIVKQAGPEAAEKLSYGMPYYSLNGRLLYFAAFKDHISLFAMPSAIKAFSSELSDYQISKGTIRFPSDKPLPLELIRKIVEFRIKENLAKQK